MAAPGLAAAPLGLPPPAPGYLSPPTWPVSLEWTEEEQRALEAGMQRYPPDRYDVVQRYTKVAAMLPRKSARDVALRVRWTINQQMLKKRRPGEPLQAAGGAPGGAKRPMMPGGMPPKGMSGLPSVPLMAGSMPHMPSTALLAEGLGDSPVVSGPIAQLLEANFVILNEFRSNMSEFRVPENTQLLVQFRDNILAIINAMEAMGGVMAQMPQLPVRLNVDLANNFLPTRPASLSPYQLAMPPPQPALNAPGMVPMNEEYHGGGGAGAGTGAGPPQHHPSSGAVAASSAVAQQQQPQQQQQQQQQQPLAPASSLPIPPGGGVAFMGGSSLFSGAPTIIKQEKDTRG